MCLISTYNDTSESPFLLKLLKRDYDTTTELSSGQDYNKISLDLTHIQVRHQERQTREDMKKTFAGKIKSYTKNYGKPKSATENQ